MNKMTYLCLISVALLFTGCSSKMYFNVFLNHDLSCFDFSKDSWKGYQIEYNGYVLLAVEKKEGGRIVPAIHYRIKHDRVLFERSIKEYAISFREPELLINNKLIIDRPSGQLGVAIKRQSEDFFRVYWLTDSDIEKINNRDGKVGTLILPACNNLPLIKNFECQNIGRIKENTNYEGYSYSLRAINTGGLDIRTLRLGVDNSEEFDLSPNSVTLLPKTYYISRYFCVIPDKKISITWYKDDLLKKINIKLKPPNEFTKKNGKAINFYINPESESVSVSFDVLDESTGFIKEIAN